MATISLCMIVKNEEMVIGRCLDCVRDIADEIIIVDTGSTDRTKEIIQQYTKKIYDFKWIDDFAAARNFAFSKAAMEYTMWLDADDVISPENQKLLLNLKRSLQPSTDIVMLKYDVAFDEQGNSTFSYYRERIFRTARHFQWVGAIHEVIPQCGTVEYSDISIWHKKIQPAAPDRNLRIFEKLLSDGRKLDPRQKYYYARELMYNQRYNEAIENLRTFLLEKKGWVENNINACKDLAQCYYSINDSDAALESLFWSFSFDVPRAEICCDIGSHFLQKKQYSTAVFWYDLASQCKMDDKSGGFCMPDCYGFIPYLQLCVCYDRMGDSLKAREYNEKAGLIKPNDKSYLYNKTYFSTTANID